MAGATLTKISTIMTELCQVFITIGEEFTVQ